MNKEELEKEAKEYAEENQIYVGEYCSYNHLVKAYLAGAESREKQIQIDAEQIRALQKDKGELTDKVKKLETSVSNLRKDNKELREVLPKLDKENDELKYKISLLLSCKDCPENKGGLICSKEYNDKCLAQKIEYIKELKEENKVLAQNLEDTEIINKALEKEVTELKGEADSVLDNWCKGDDPCPHLKKRDEQLNNAKEIIKDLLSLCEGETDSKLVFTRAEQFLKDN